MATSNLHIDQPELDALCINTIRFLSVGAIQKANSGHPGLPMGAASLAYVLWTRFLRHNLANPSWFDRDRFVLSAGHGSPLGASAPGDVLMAEFGFTVENVYRRALELLGRGDETT